MRLLWCACGALQAFLGDFLEACPADEGAVLAVRRPPPFGARPLKRAIQKYIEDPFAEEIILGKVKEGDQIKIDYNEKTNSMSLSKKN